MYKSNHRNQMGQASLFRAKHYVLQSLDRNLSLVIFSEIYDEFPTGPPKYI
jgi:hypothetical protein